MHRRILGRGGPEVSALGLGCMGFSGGIYGPTQDAQSIEAARRGGERAL